MLSRRTLRWRFAPPLPSPFPPLPLPDMLPTLLKPSDVWREPAPARLYIASGPTWLGTATGQGKGGLFSPPSPRRASTFAPSPPTGDGRCDAGLCPGLGRRPTPPPAGLGAAGTNPQEGDTLRACVHGLASGPRRCGARSPWGERGPGPGSAAKSSQWGRWGRERRFPPARCRTAPPAFHRRHFAALKQRSWEGDGGNTDVRDVRRRTGVVASVLG